MYKKGDMYISGVALTPQNREFVEYISAYFKISRSAAIRLIIDYVSDMTPVLMSPHMLKMR
mgnify:CR=1 FL=1